MAYVPLCALRRIGLHHTPFGNATCGTIRSSSSKSALSYASAPAVSKSRWHRASRGTCLGQRCRPSRRCRKRARLACLTRGAATRYKRGTRGPPRPLRGFRSQISFKHLSRLPTPHGVPTSLLANLPPIAIWEDFRHTRKRKLSSQRDCASENQAAVQKLSIGGREPDAEG